MLIKISSLLLLGVGIFLLVQFVMPIISYKAWEYIIYPKQNLALIKPYSETDILGVSIATNQNFPAFTSTIQRSNNPLYKNFTLSIPSIKVTDALVTVDSNNIDNSLGHLPGTALPGQKGNVFISGHSALPQFFKPDNYKVVFANLPDIKKGEQIIISAGGQKYEYVVKGINIIDPKETWVINPPDQTGRYLTLMTCVPPGLYLKRLIVLAELKI